MSLKKLKKNKINKNEKLYIEACKLAVQCSHVMPMYIANTAAEPFPTVAVVPGRGYRHKHLFALCMSNGKHYMCYALNNKLDFFEEIRNACKYWNAVIKDACDEVSI